MIVTILCRYACKFYFQAIWASLVNLSSGGGKVPNPPHTASHTYAKGEAKACNYWAITATQSLQDKKAMLGENGSPAHSYTLPDLLWPPVTAMLTQFPSKL